MESEMKTYTGTIYSTPDNWGDKTFYFDFDGMEDNIHQLQKVDGFSDISIDECGSYEFEERLGAGAVYRLGGVREDYYAVFSEIDSSDEGREYKHLAGDYSSVEDAVSQLD